MLGGNYPRGNFPPFSKHRVVGADVVELSAQGDAASDFAAARLAAKLIALALRT
jgi:arginase family enzyme